MSLIISVAGAHSNCGKTTVCELLLKNLSGKWGAIKYTKTAFYTSVSDETSIQPDGKDTQRMLSAGAHRVLWLQAPIDALSETLPVAIDMLSECTGLVIEGNSPIEFLSPDIVIFVFGRDIKRVKASAQLAIKKADFIILNVKSIGTQSFKKETFCLSDSKEKEDFIKKLMERVKELSLNKAIEHIKRVSKDKKISCAQARRIAEEYGLPYKTIGEIANNEGIKIKNCELGCF